MNKIDFIIKECVANILKESDIVSNEGVKRTKANRVWEMVYLVMDNIQTYMQETEKNKKIAKQRISDKEIADLVGYIKMTINNALSIDYPNLKIN
ncbi:MAG: hypothetical protein MJZ24_07860 [Paludibacteraceae bacterium]|nr:hypothetical protein [Paludibacteraceae bacterium]